MNPGTAAADYLWNTVSEDVLHDEYFSFSQSNLGPTAESSQARYSEAVKVYFNAHSRSEQADIINDAQAEADTGEEFLKNPYRYIELLLGVKIEREINHQIALKVADERSAA